MFSENFATAQTLSNVHTHERVYVSTPLDLFLGRPLRISLEYFERFNKTLVNRSDTQWNLKRCQIRRFSDHMVAITTGGFGLQRIQSTCFACQNKLFELFSYL